MISCGKTHYFSGGSSQDKDFGLKRVSKMIEQGLIDETEWTDFSDLSYDEEFGLTW